MKELGKCYNLSFMGELKVPQIDGLVRNLENILVNRYKTSRAGQYPESDINCISLDTTCISMRRIICITI